MTVRDEQLEEKIQNRLTKLEISNLVGQEEGVSYLSKVIYELITNTSFDDVYEAQSIVAKKEQVPLYELQTKIASVVNMANEETLKGFYKSEDYNLKLVCDTIELIADDIIRE